MPSLRNSRPSFLRNGWCFQWWDIIHRKAVAERSSRAATNHLFQQVQPTFSQLTLTEKTLWNTETPAGHLLGWFSGARLQEAPRQKKPAIHCQFSVGTKLSSSPWVPKVEAHLVHVPPGSGQWTENTLLITLCKKHLINRSTQQENVCQTDN